MINREYLWWPCWTVSFSFRLPFQRHSNASDARLKHALIQLPDPDFFALVWGRSRREGLLGHHQIAAVLESSFVPPDHTYLGRTGWVEQEPARLPSEPHTSQYTGLVVGSVLTLQEIHTCSKAYNYFQSEEFTTNLLIFVAISFGILSTKDNFKTISGCRSLTSITRKDWNI